MPRLRLPFDGHATEAVTVGLPSIFLAVVTGNPLARTEAHGVADSRLEENAAAARLMDA